MDVSFLNHASPIFAHQVLKNGALLYGDVRRAKQFIIETLTRYFDYLPMHQFFVERMKKQLGVRGHG